MNGFRYNEIWRNVSEACINYTGISFLWNERYTFYFNWFFINYRMELSDPFPFCSGKVLLWLWRKSVSIREIESENASWGNWLSIIRRLFCHFILEKAVEMTEHRIGWINTKCGQVDKVDNFLSVKVLFTQSEIL